MELEREHPGVKQSMLKALGQRRAAPSARHAAESAGTCTRGRPRAPAASTRRSCRSASVAARSSSADSPERPPDERRRPARVVGRVRRRRRARSARSTAACSCFVGVERDDGPADVAVHRRQDPRAAHLRGPDDPRQHEPLGPGRRRRGAGRLAVHAGRRLPEGPAAVVRRRRARPRSRGRCTRTSSASCGAAGLHVETGEFQAMMQVSLVNDGPVTLLLDSEKAILKLAGGGSRMTSCNSRWRSHDRSAACARALAVVAALCAGRPPPSSGRSSTEDPEPIGAGRVLLEGGVDFAHDQQYPVSGLNGNLLAHADARRQRRPQLDRRAADRRRALRSA